MNLPTLSPNRQSQTCENCWFWFDKTCRRNSPRPYFQGNGFKAGDYIYWPRTNAESWCGEWAPREVA